MEINVWQLIIDWVQKDSTIDGLTVNGIYDILKCGTKSLSSKIMRFFKTEEESNNFLYALQSKPVNSQNNLEEQIKLIYNEVCSCTISQQSTNELLCELKSWLLTNVQSQTFNNTSAKVYQKAGRDIFNVQGTLIINQNRGD